MEMVSVNGLAEARKALEQLPLNFEKKVLRAGLRQGAKVVLAAARNDAPERTGAIKRNIKIRGSRGKPGVIALSVGVGAKDFTGKTFYASFVLYGHKTRPQAKDAKGRYGKATGPRGSGQHMVAANNFLERALDQTGQAAIETTIAAWSAQLEAMGVR